MPAFRSSANTARSKPVFFERMRDMSWLRAGFDSLSFILSAVGSCWLPVFRHGDGIVAALRQERLHAPVAGELPVKLPLQVLQERPAECFSIRLAHRERVPAVQVVEGD